MHNFKANFPFTVNIKLKESVDWDKIMTGCWNSTVQSQIYWQDQKHKYIYKLSGCYCFPHFLQYILIAWYELFLQLEKKNTHTF